MGIDHADPEEPHLHRSSRPLPRPRRQPPGQARRAPRGAEGAAGRTRPTSATTQRWTGKGDERRQVEKQQRVRPWWRADGSGHVVFSVFHGTRPIEFEKGKAGIAVASRDKLPALIDGLIGAAQAGELDDLLAPREAGGRAQGQEGGLSARTRARAAPRVARAHFLRRDTIAMARRRGRPPGTTGRAAVLSPNQVRHAFRVARTRGRHAARAEAALAMSLGLGLRAKELAGLRWADVYDEAGKVRPVVHLQGRPTPRAAGRATCSCRRRRCGACWRSTASATGSAAPGPRRRRCFASQKGGPMTAGSMARFLKALYAEAGIAGASSHSGRRTLITRLAERGIDLKSIARDRGAHQHPHDGDVCRGQPEAARAHPAGRDVLSFDGPRNVCFLTKAHKSSWRRNYPRACTCKIDDTGRARQFKMFRNRGARIGQDCLPVIPRIHKRRLLSGSFSCSH